MLRKMFKVIINIFNIILLSDRVVTILLVTSRDIILECYLSDITRRIILLLFSGHVTTYMMMTPGIILLLFNYYFQDTSPHV